MVSFLLVAKLLTAATEINTSYHQLNAELAVKYAGAAYCCGTLGQGVLHWDCYACKMLPQMNATVFSDRATNTNGFVGFAPQTNRIWVWFAGTDPASIKHWIDDADFVQAAYNVSDCSGCKVHAGFYKCWKAVQQAVTRQVDLLLQVRNSPPVTCTHNKHPHTRASFTHLRHWSSPDIPSARASRHSQRSTCNAPTGPASAIPSHSRRCIPLARSGQVGNTLCFSPDLSSPHLS